MQHTVYIDDHQSSQSHPDTFVKFATHKLHNLVDLIVAELKIIVQTVWFGDGFTHFTGPVNATGSNYDLYRWKVILNISY